MMKEYEDISDEELIRRAQNGEKKLEELLIDKYKGMVLKKAHAMFLIGGEQEDLIPGVVAPVSTGFCVIIVYNVDC